MSTENKSKAAAVKIASTAPLTKFTTVQSKLTMVNNASDSYDTVDYDLCEFETIQSTLRRIQEHDFTAVSGSAGDLVPILNITKAATSDLRSLLSLFMPDPPKSETRNEIAEKLLGFIPKATIQVPHSKQTNGANLCAGCSSKHHWYGWYAIFDWYANKFSACSWCSRQFCKMCPLEVRHYPRTGLASCTLCTECIKDITREDTNDWAEASIKFLANPNEESIMASLGCAFVAMAMGADSQELLKKTAKELHNRGVHAVAYNLVSLALSHSDGCDKEEMKLYFLASSILKSLAKDQSKTWEEKWSLALASKEAYITALSKIVDKDIEILETKAKDEIDDLVLQLHSSKIFQYTQTLDALWEERDILKILNFLREITTDGHDMSSVVGESASQEAFKSFLHNKEHFLPKMIPEDRQLFLFLKGVLELKDAKLQSALEYFETVAWNSSQSRISKEDLLSAYLCMLTNHHSKVYSYEALNRVMKSGSKSLLFSKPVHTLLEERSMSLLFPTNEELTPPFKANWPSLSIVDHNTRCHQRYEEAVMKLYNEKKWSYIKVSYAYMDEYPGCEHPAEMVVCYLHAAMWMAKKFGPKSKIDPKVLFGYKSVLMQLLHISFAIATRFLNPGMELYVIRLAIGIFRKIALVPDSKLVFTEQDSDFLQELLKRLLKVSRMFPFWNPPSVSVSEAVMLNIVTRNLHSNFILELQFLKPEQRPLTELDLTYQLYENDLRGVLPLENSSDSRARAMDELLKSQGWSWNDVRQTMSTQLCPRDQDGWIIQTLHLGTSQQYSEITGFVVDTDADHPSIQLLVVEANPREGRVGLFSQEDINTMLHLDLDDLPLFFSLDPPSHDLGKQFHPFQQWRYATNKVKGTEVLNTLFITDYLMKSFTVGSDVSSLPPFKQRPCKSGLTKNLPRELQEAIRSIRERGGIHSRSDSHRFWIETEEIKFDCQQNGSKVEYRFGEMKMKVKSHSLSRDADGTLKDTDEDDDPDSPHSTFARDMTKQYSQLGKYFPVFARLQQLSKLQLFSLMLQSLLQNIKEQSQGERITDARRQHRTNLSAALNEMKQQIGSWPKAENHSLIRSKVDEIEREIREDMRKQKNMLYQLYGFNITIDDSDARRMLNGVESRVIEAFRRNDEDELNQITKALESSLKVSTDYHLKQYVRNWLSNNSDRYSRSSKTPQESLIEYLCSKLPVPTRDEIYNATSHHRERYQALSRLIAPYKNPHKPANSCTWVPAAISPQGFSISYGGVALNIRASPIRDGETLPRSRNETKASLQRKSIAAAQASRVNYSTPKGNAEGSSGTGSSGRSNNNSWNDTNSGGSSGSASGGTTRLPREAAAAAAASNDDRRKQSQTAAATTWLQDIVKGPSSTVAAATTRRLAVASSTFRGKNTTELNDKLDRLSHGVNISKPSIFSPPGGGGKRGGRGSGGSGGGGSGGSRGGGSGGGGGDGGGRGNGDFITGCKGKESLANACRSPTSILKQGISLDIPVVRTPGSGGVRNSSDIINGLYVIKNTKTGKVYVGRSCHVFRRITQHQRDIQNGQKTVGGFISSVENMEFCLHELPINLSLEKMRFHEQQLLIQVKNEYGTKVMNKINAMNMKDYRKLQGGEHLHR